MVVRCGCTERQFSLLLQWARTSRALCAIQGLQHGRTHDLYRLYLQTFIESLDAQIALRNHSSPGNQLVVVRDLGDVILSFAQQRQPQRLQPTPSELVKSLQTVKTSVQQVIDSFEQPPTRLVQELTPLLAYATAQLEHRHYRLEPVPCITGF